MQFNFGLIIITADYPNPTAELRLLDARGSQLVFKGERLDMTSVRCWRDKA